MSEPSPVVPVVAHRVFGTRFARPGTRRASSRLSGPLRDLRLEVPERADIAAASRILFPTVDRTHGTRRSVEEVEAFFQPNDRLDYTSGLTVNDLWRPAGIGFRLLAIVDDMVESDLADFWPNDSRLSRPYAARLGRPDVLNLYFVREIGGAWGFASLYAPSVSQAPYAFVRDRADLEVAIGLAFRWRSEVLTTAHEFGHVLGLPHMPDYDNLMYGYGHLDSSEELEMTQWRIAQDRARLFPPFVRVPDLTPQPPVEWEREWPSP